MKFSFAIVAALCMLFVVVSADETLHRNTFETWMTTHGKVYQSKIEMESRFNVFKMNLAKAEALNNGPHGATFGATKFADLTPEEFKMHYLNYRHNSAASSEGNVMKGLNIRRTFEHPVNAAGNQTIDWVAVGATTPVKDQGQCGSCWAFSATEEIESMTFMAGKPIPVLAPQQIVSCDTQGNDQGCNGGLTEGAYAYVVAAGGMDTEASYPYEAKDLPCKFNADNVAATITGFTYAVPKPTIMNAKHACDNAEAALAKAPISVCVDAEPWQLYQSGIMKQSACSASPLKLDHCVQLTGMDVDSNGEAYWVVRNSWAAGWGNAGSIYLERGTGINTCGVCDDMTFATVN